ncbi:hypothetical protein BDN70DRAFT_940010 [Pholiota conissans]|uniref:Uncharacterized protein n=1 Tax=Pholiota conissans TaxID=109636 RepID=A0A9P5YK75_9AGAR|nr:hypothetical protein BDN70DRAFT_940010 [Pholiota conissans]
MPSPPRTHCPYCILVHPRPIHHPPPCAIRWQHECIEESPGSGAADNGRSEYASSVVVAPTSPFLLAIIAVTFRLLFRWSWLSSMAAGRPSPPSVLVVLHRRWSFVRDRRSRCYVVRGYLSWPHIFLRHSPLVMADRPSLLLGRRCCPAVVVARPSSYTVLLARCPHPSSVVPVRGFAYPIPTVRPSILIVVGGPLRRWWHASA